jgi:plastocyanin
VNKHLLFIAPLLATAVIAAGCGSDGGTGSSAKPAGNGGYGYTQDKPKAAATTEAAAKPAAAAETVVKLTNTTFQPSTLKAKVGDKITFVNADPIAHTATAQDGSFDSGTLDAGAKFSFTAKQAGKISYVCEFHPGMTGTIDVS